MQKPVTVQFLSEKLEQLLIGQSCASSSAAGAANQKLPLFPAFYGISVGRILCFSASLLSVTHTGKEVGREGGREGISSL